MIALERTFTGPIPDKHEARYLERGITTLHGNAQFTGPSTLSVGGAGFSSRYSLIASGAEPATLGIPGEEHLADNEMFLGLEELPERIVFVGGGYIATEFSQVAARAGAKVTILQRGPRILSQFEPELVEWLMDAFRSLRIDVRTATTVVSVEEAEGAYRIEAQSADGLEVIEADLVIHAAGRTPALARLNLAAAGVEVENGQLKLNEFLQSATNPATYVAGDAAQVGAPLTPVSGHDAKVVAANLVEGNHAKPNYRGVPSVAFSLTLIAAVGVSEAQAKTSGCAYAVKSERASGRFTARREAESIYGYKMIVEDGSRRILGAHLVGPHADEVINLFGLAIRHGLTARSQEHHVCLPDRCVRHRLHALT